MRIMVRGLSLTKGNIWRFLATSDHPLATLARKTRTAISHFSVPAPSVIAKPALLVFLLIRATWYFIFRVLACEPLLKAYCTSYGKDLHTDVFVHWIQGKGNLIIGDNVTLSGKCSISFAARFCDRPTLVIGSGTHVSDGCILWIGKQITIGEHCMIGSDVAIRDSDGHPADPELRRKGTPPAIDDVRPVTIGNTVWIGMRAIIGPGISIGDGSIVAAGSVVVSDVAPYTVVAGNPARRIGSLQPPAANLPVFLCAGEN